VALQLGFELWTRRGLKKRQKLGKVVASNKAEKNRSRCSPGTLAQQFVRKLACRPERQHAAKGYGELIGKHDYRQRTRRGAQPSPCAKRLGP
jgi:hypothetical protein